MSRCRRFDCSKTPAGATSQGARGVRLSSMAKCTDPVVGKILAGWRYDISGLAPEMRGDYEAHLAECEFCRSRQRLHRGHRHRTDGVWPRPRCSFSSWPTASSATSIPVTLSGWRLARSAGSCSPCCCGCWSRWPPRLRWWSRTRPCSGARVGLEKLPEEIRDRIPEDLRLKISGQS